jgi:DNA-binding CsgD family transcriptional regulator
MEQMSAAVGAAGAVLLQSDVRTPDVPRTASVEELVQRYFADDWPTRDLRGNRGIPLLARGVPVILDQDFVTSDQMQCDAFYNECLIPEGFQWFAGVGFWAESALWILTFQRTSREGPFEAGDKRCLARLAERMTETASLSKAVGRVALSGVTNGLDLVHHPAVALDRLGFVLDTNASAERMFDNDVRLKDRRLYVRDKRASALFDSLCEKLRVTPDFSPIAAPAIVVRRERKRPVIIRTMPIPGAARSPFLGARALLTFLDLEPKPAANVEMLSALFGLTPAEARLAALAATGLSPQQLAKALQVTESTARNQLKAVFAKTGTHRQSELVALISRLALL